jgi:hypothetical protein
MKTCKFVIGQMNNKDIECGDILTMSEEKYCTIKGITPMCFGHQQQTRTKNEKIDWNKVDGINRTFEEGGGENG